MTDEAYQRAKKRVKELKEFYGHVVTYVVINIVLIIINLLTGPGYLWFLWVTVFWGLAVVLHGSKLFLVDRLFGKDWEERKIKELMDKEQ